MKDKLKEILRAVPISTTYPEYIEALADKLIAEGVEVFPLKTGQIIYALVECSCENIDGKYTECQFYGYGENDRMCTRESVCPYIYYVRSYAVTESTIYAFSKELGSTVFLTREEAEKALAERSDE